MKGIPFLLTALLSACGGPECYNDGILSEQGFCVEPGKFDVDIDALDAIIVSALSHYSEVYPDELSGIQKKIEKFHPRIVFYRFEDDKLGRLGHTSLFADAVFVAYKDECMGNTALGHELQHLFLELADKDGDTHHTNVLLFESGTYLQAYNSSENKTNKDECEDKCGECFWQIVQYYDCLYDGSCSVEYSLQCDYDIKHDIREECYQ